jgi:bifunctional DNase/RNase
MDKKIAIKVTSIIKSQDEPQAFVLLMQEIDGERKFPIVIGPLEAQAIAFQINHVKPVRPLTHDVLGGVLLMFDIILSEVIIYKAEAGVYYAYIYLTRGEENARMDVRPSDAIALALRFNVPVCIYESILTREALSSDMLRDSSDDDVSVRNIASKETSWLEANLKRAIEEENYELASVLRDEIARRKAI